MARDIYQCTICDSQMAKTGRVGHLKFFDGEGHGPKQEFPDGYDDNPEDYFIEVDSGNSGDSESGDESESSDSPGDGESGNSDTSGGQQRTSESGGESGNEQSPPDETGTGGQTGALSRFKTWLTTPIFDK